MQKGPWILTGALRVLALKRIGRWFTPQGSVTANRLLVPSECLVPHQRWVEAINSIFFFFPGVVLKIENKHRGQDVGKARFVLALIKKL